MREAFRGRFLRASSVGARWGSRAHSRFGCGRTSERTLQEMLSESEVRRLGYLCYPEVERIKVAHLPDARTMRASSGRS